MRKTKMKKKDKFWKELPFYSWVLIVLVLIFLGYLFFPPRFKESFDREKHDCTKYKIEGEYVVIEMEFQAGVIPTHLPPIIYQQINKTCVEWEDKNYCEIHPNDEELCVCEEYYYQNKTRTFKLGEGMPLIFEVTPIGAGFREPCEKAREKTIEDLSCEELQKYFDCEKDNWNIPDRKKCMGYDYTKIKNRPKRNRLAILNNIMLTKNCFNESLVIEETLAISKDY
ncbi:MAG: hypothetical protein ACFFCW_21590 [Candidatus Hodarchaeota archaeon]